MHIATPLPRSLKSTSLLVHLALALAGCAVDDSDISPAPLALPTVEQQTPTALGGAEKPAPAPSSLHMFERRVLTGDVVEYSAVVPVGPGPSDRIRIHRVVRERAPFKPRSTRAAVMMLHGDFSTFDSNFVLASLPGAESPGPSLAVHLASQDIDVWGFDRRWALLPADTTDFSSLTDQGFVSAIGDTEKALALARVIRGSAGRFALLGFSSGAVLAYAYAGHETQRPPGLRHVRALVPLDAYYRIGPDHEADREAACARAQLDQEYLDAGYVESDNSFFPYVAQLSLDAPDDPSPFLDGATNHDALLFLLTQTYHLFDPNPWYHLGAGTFDAGWATGLRYSPVARMTDWLLQAVPFQATREVADYDAIWCGEGTLPVPDRLASIQVPVYAVAAAGGFGELARYTTQQLGSNDVTFSLVRGLPVGQEHEDYGHGDLLYAHDAPQLVWDPLASWILAH